MSVNTDAIAANELWSFVEKNKNDMAKLQFFSQSQHGHFYVADRFFSPFSLNSSH